MANFKIILPGHPLRRATEKLVKSVYATQYGANISTFPDLLVALVNADGKPYCAAGLRVGLRDCFSETYLDDTIQNVISNSIREQVCRENILEVANLASVRMGASFVLMREIIAYGRERGIRFCVFTATQRLRRVLKATRIPLLEMSRADKSRVSNPDDWGSYYESNPWVCALDDTFLQHAKCRLSVANDRSQPHTEPQLLVA